MVRASTSADLLEGVFRHALDAIVLIDDDGRYITVNPAMCDLVGRSRDELLSLSTGELSAGAPGELEAWWRTFFDQGFAEGEFPVRHSSGSILQVEFRAVANVLPGSHLAILRDVTERRRVEEELRDREAHLALLLDQVPAGIWTVDHDLVFTSTSGRILRALGLRVGSLTGTSLTELGERVELPELVVAAHHEALAGHRWSGTFEWLRRTWQCDVEPLHRGRETVGAVGLAVDITETVQTKQQLEETVAELRLVDREREHLLERLLRVEHEERSRIARELHDDLGQVLVSASLYARWFADRFDGVDVAGGGGEPIAWSSCSARPWSPAARSPGACSPGRSRAEASSELWRTSPSRSATPSVSTCASRPASSSHVWATATRRSSTGSRRRRSPTRCATRRPPRCG